MPSERHTFIIPGVSREAYQDVAVRATVEDSDLAYYLHGHPFDPFHQTPCNDRCQVVRNGNVEFVTQMADANPAEPRVT